MNSSAAHKKRNLLVVNVYQADCHNSELIRELNTINNDSLLEDISESDRANVYQHFNVRAIMDGTLLMNLWGRDVAMNILYISVRAWEQHYLVRGLDFPPCDELCQSPAKILTSMLIDSDIENDYEIVQLNINGKFRSYHSVVDGVLPNHRAFNFTPKTHEQREFLRLNHVDCKESTFTSKLERKLEIFSSCLYKKSVAGDGVGVRNIVIQKKLDLERISIRYEPLQPLMFKGRRRCLAAWLFLNSILSFNIESKSGLVVELNLFEKNDQVL